MRFEGRQIQPYNSQPWGDISAQQLVNRYVLPIEQVVPTTHVQPDLLDPLLPSPLTALDKAQTLARQAVDKVLTVTSPYILRFLVKISLSKEMYC